MSYSALLNSYREENNNFDYKHDKLYAQVRKAMELQDEEARAEALKELFRRNYLADAARYEAYKRQSLRNIEKLNNEENRLLIEQVQSMAEPHIFFEQYTNLIAEMVKDVDKHYPLAPMFGMTSVEAKDLVSTHLNSYTRYDREKELFNSESREEAMRKLEASKLRGENRDYTNANENEKKLLKETYIRQQIVKEKLASKSSYWKFFHPWKTKEMENFIKAANETLREAKFPRAAEVEASYDFSFSTATTKDYRNLHTTVDDLYLTETNRDMVRNHRNIKYYDSIHAEDLKDILETQDVADILPNKQQIDTIEQNIEAPEGKYSVNRKFLRINYIPDLDHLEKEIEELRNMKNAFSADHVERVRSDVSNVSYDYKIDGANQMPEPLYEHFRELISRNMNRATEIKGMVEKDGRAAAEQYIRNQTDPNKALMWEGKESSWWINQNYGRKCFFENVAKNFNSKVPADKQIKLEPPAIFLTNKNAAVDKANPDVNANVNSINEIQKEESNPSIQSMPANKEKLSVHIPETKIKDVKPFDTSTHTAPSMVNKK